VATPPHELHELGALMAAASAAAEGWNVTYLGADLPVADLMSAAGQIDARAVAISTVHLPEDADLPATLRTIRAGLSERVPLLVGGTAARKLEADAEAAGALVIESLPEFRTALRRLAAEDAE
jgi:methanogenic corrinoid protein MtbC1